MLVRHAVAAVRGSLHTTWTSLLLVSAAAAAAPADAVAEVAPLYSYLGLVYRG